MAKGETKLLPLLPQKPVEMELSPGTGSMVEPGHSWAVQVSSWNCKVTKLGGKGVPGRGYRQKAPLGGRLQARNTTNSLPKNKGVFFS